MAGTELFTVITKDRAFRVRALVLRRTCGLCSRMWVFRFLPLIVTLRFRRCRLVNGWALRGRSSCPWRARSVAAIVLHPVRGSARFRTGARKTREQLKSAELWWSGAIQVIAAVPCRPRRWRCMVFGHRLGFPS